jgi:hypothetical protein
MVKRVRIDAIMKQLKRDAGVDPSITEVLAEVNFERRSTTPRKYNPKIFPRSAKFLAQRGATQAEIAQCFNVSTRVLQHWLTIYPELREAVTVGNEAFDSRVERSLAEQAIGYFVDIPVYVTTSKKVTEIGVKRQYFPPNVTAGIYWTKNRMPEKWRDVQRHDVTATVLKSSDELRQALLLEFKDLVDQGLLQLPAPGKMKEINPRDDNE